MGESSGAGVQVLPLKSRPRREPTQHSGGPGETATVGDGARVLQPQRSLVQALTLSLTFLNSRYVLDVFLVSPRESGLVLCPF